MKKRPMKNPTKFGVKSIGKQEYTSSPSHLFIVKNPPSDVDPNVTDEQLDDALLQHCETSQKQLLDLKK